MRILLIVLGSFLAFIYFFTPKFVCAYLHKHFSTSWGRINREIAIKEIKDYKETTLKHLGNVEGNLVVVGHMGGNYKRYPFDWREIEIRDYSKNKKSIYRTYNVSELLESAFVNVNLGLDGVEFDLQMGPSNTIYITHNSLKGFEDANAKTKSWFENNTLEILIKKFSFLHKRHNLSPKLYLEIKCKDDRILSNEELLLIGRTLEIINVNLKENLKNHISFVSFNLNALRVIGQSDNHYELFFILATNTNTGYLASHFSCTEYLNFFDKHLKKALISDSNLTGIWFDPVHFKNFVTHLNEINKQRKNKALNIYISTYRLPKPQYIKRIRESREKLNNLSGIIFDLMPSQ